MDYSSLILMERDNETGFVTKELGSYKVSEGAEHIKGFYVKGDNVEYIEEKLSLSIELIEEAMEKAFNDIEGKEEEYQ